MFWLLGRWVRVLLCILWLLPAFAAADVGNRLIKRTFSGFEVLIDCQRRGAVFFQYTLLPDNGSLDRYDDFYRDPEVPAECQQLSTDTYRARGQRYDRGHLVPANHLDHDAIGIRQSNMMTNILPQAANMNRGAWYQTEKIAECYRDRGKVLVLGGVIWGDNRSDDHFLASHGVATPDAFWKVLYHSGKVIAWLIPNSQEATAKRLDRYLISLPSLTEITGVEFSFPENILKQEPSQSWFVSGDCRLG